MEKIDDIKAYLKEHENKQLLRFITCGNVDDGKSTLIGRLLHDSKGIFEDQLENIKKDSKKTILQTMSLIYLCLLMVYKVKESKELLLMLLIEILQQIKESLLLQILQVMSNIQEIWQRGLVRQTLPPLIVTGN